MFAELSTNAAGAANGTFELSPYPTDGTSKIGNNRFRSRGTAIAAALNTTLTAEPRTNVLAAVGNISGDICVLRSNGVQVASSTTDQGAGNYGNHPLFIGARDNTSLFFNGWLTSLIIRGAQSTQSQIEATEAWVNQRTGAY
jgi:hypothetical protein